MRWGGTSALLLAVNCWSRELKEFLSKRRGENLGTVAVLSPGARGEYQPGPGSLAFLHGKKKGGNQEAFCKKKC